MNMEGTETSRRTQRVQVMKITLGELLSNTALLERVRSELIKIRYLLQTHSGISENAYREEWIGNVDLLFRVVYVIAEERWDVLSELRLLDLDAVLAATLYDLTFYFNLFPFDKVDFLQWLTAEQARLDFEQALN